jgi:Type I phosphodiesterase / nucleotide pyrophosphatase
MQKFLFLAAIICSLQLSAQNKIENIIVITSDGLRWQDLFTGMDPDIASDKRFNQGDSAYLWKKYFHSDVNERRKKLMPFMWNTIVNHGQIYGNRVLGNKVNNANPFWFSYPGYNEILTGNPDTAINTNDYPPNPYETVLEYLNKLVPYKGKIAAFGAWEAFDRIINEQRSGIPVVCAYDTVKGNLNEKQKLLNAMLQDSYKPFGNSECLDVFTHHMAMEYLKVNKPKVLYIAYGDTDEWAHHAQYKFYLDAIHQVDQWISEIWNYVQSTPEYRNKTAIFITTDHGRGGIDKSKWTDHGQSVQDASEIWFAVMAPGLNAKGEVKTGTQVYQKQFAKTIAALLGVNYTPVHTTGDAVDLK